MSNAPDWQTLYTMATVLCATCGGGAFAVWWLSGQFDKIRRETNAGREGLKIELMDQVDKVETSVKAAIGELRRDFCDDLHSVKADANYVRDRVDRLSEGRPGPQPNPRRR